MAKEDRTDVQKQGLNTRENHTSKGFLATSTAMASDLAATAKAATKLTAGKAEQAKITNVSLPKAFLPLGRSLYESGRYRESHTQLYSKLDRINERIRNLEGNLENRSGETTASKAKALAASARDAGHVKALQRQLKHGLSELGLAVFDAEGVNCGPQDLVEPIEELSRRYSLLEVEIARLNAQGYSRIFTLKQFTVGVMAVLVAGTIGIAGMMLGRGNYKSVDTNENDHGRISGISSQQSIGSPGKGTLTEIKNSKKFPGKTPASPYDKIKQPEIPFELQVPDLPSEVVKVYPDSLNSFKVFSRGKYIFHYEDNGSWITSIVDGSVVDIGLYSPKTLSVSGQYAFMQGEGISQVTRRGLKRLVSFEDKGDKVASYDGSPIVDYTGGFNNDCQFSPKDTFFWIAEDYGQILIVSVNERRTVQSIANAIPPLMFSEDERRFYCRDNNNLMMMYEWDGRQYQGKAKTRLFSNDQQIYHVMNDRFISPQVYQPGSPWLWGLSVLNFSDGEAELSFSKAYGLKMYNGPVWEDSLKPPYAVRGSRVAWVAIECDDEGTFQNRWLYYADTQNGLIKKYSLPSGTIVDLDFSGRYAYVKELVHGGVAVYRLESL